MKTPKSTVVGAVVDPDTEQPPSGSITGGAGGMHIAEAPSSVRKHSNAPEHGASGLQMRLQMPSAPQIPEMQSPSAAQRSPTTPRVGAQMLAEPTSVQS